MKDEEKSTRVVGLDGKMFVVSEKPLETEPCPRCGKPVYIGDKFCQVCGTNMFAVRSGT